MTNSRPLADLDPDIGPVDDSYGVMFECPACDQSHSIYVPWRGVSPFPSGAMWRLESAEGIATLTLSPSIDCSGSPGCQFHGFVKSGQVTW